MEEDEITVRPIAGTRPRGKTTEEDKALEQELLSDPKELAEHLMLIDLGRNDAGRVSQIGTVKLTANMVIEPPACSNAHQKKITKNEKTPITINRSRTTFLDSVSKGSF